jgi:16S rRNA (guanine527-N7)-methyltransferase
MSTLSLSRIAELLRPYSVEYDPGALESLSAFLDLLVKWNARTNLTAIRDPEEIVRRHFGESLFVARYLPACSTLLDLGSGAGFPGLPIQIARPGLNVTLAESQNKKASFLREAVRTLGLTTEVWGSRAEELSDDRRFDVVTLRAVDRPVDALKLARERVIAGGTVAHLTVGEEQRKAGDPILATDEWDWSEIAVPGGQSLVLRLERHVVPRGTCGKRAGT